MRGRSRQPSAFWQAVEWVYVHTQRRPGLARRPAPPALTPAIEQCIASERPDAAIRTQTAEATNSGVTATPSLRLHDRETGKAILLQGPIEGDACCRPWTCSRPAIPPPHHIGNACRRRRRHAQVAPVFKATAQSAALTTTRSPRILAANDHRCRGDGCTCFVPQEGLPSQGECPPISPSEVRHVFRRQ